jgi:hypothetical protein
MSMDDDVRSPKSDVRSPTSGETAVGQGFSPAGRIADDDLDRALGSLTDASPSPGLRANVMQRIEEGRGSEVRSPEVRRPWDPASLRLRSGQAAGFRWRLALASAAVILIAASVWLAVRSGPAPQTATTRTGLHDVTLPPSPQVRSTPETETTTAAQTGPASMRPDAEGARRRSVHAGSTRTATVLEPVARAPAPGDSGNPARAAAGPQVAALPELTITALPPPDALAVAPLVLDWVAVERMDIPPLEIGPVNPGEGNGRRQ